MILTDEEINKVNEKFYDFDTDSLEELFIKFFRQVDGKLDMGSVNFMYNFMHLPLCPETIKLIVICSNSKQPNQRM